MCGSALALRAAGVPIKCLAAGISVGLVTERWPQPQGGTAGGTPLDAPYPWPLDYGRHVLLTGR